MVAYQGALLNRPISQDSAVEHGVFIKYECLGNYHVGGSIMNICFNGNWANTIPSCKPYCLMSELIDPSVIVTCEFEGEPLACDRPKSGFVATINCAKGYAMPSQHISKILRCSDDGEWNLPSIKCNILRDSEAPENVLQDNVVTTDAVVNTISLIDVRGI